MSQHHTPAESRSAPVATPAPPEALPPDNSRWTGEKASAFLRALAQHGKVARAARGVGMSRQAAYRLRARAPKFAEFWDWALEEAAKARSARRSAAREVHPLLRRAG
ncbi:hypothetical protein [Altererythrobacter sp. B11]|uniref:hypothetical protein n=1 Tax=Altererythrobacter sp. B11 TaxID=2060312 RepID=UPI0011AE26DF|nr:hypothetical protein [Altererythrobacter sp. B11]